MRKDENVGIIVTARVRSNRIREKVLQKIGNRLAIEILLDHIVNPKYPVILAIPTNEADDILADIAEEKGVLCFRGNDDSPLHRIVDCADAYDFDHVVRVTADDILIDLQIMLNQIRFHLAGTQDYTYCRRLPEGCGVEVIKTDVLRQTVKDVGNKPIEFISYYIKDKYVTKEYYPHLDFQHAYRCTMDYPEDVTMLRLLFACMDSPGTLDIINFLEKHSYFCKINQLPIVTIYTCNYNTSKYIVDCMNSVVAQAFDEFEYIVLDDCSSDDSMNIITEWYTNQNQSVQKKVRILRNDTNIGLSASSNKMLNVARGRYIIRVDSDDTVLPSMLSRMVEEVKNNDCQAILSGFNSVKENGDIISYERENPFHPGCSLISRWAANELKYREDLEFMEGQEFFKRFNEAYKVRFIKDALWNYRRRPGQKTQDARHPNNTEKD